MNQIVLIGNGFDLAHGLKSRYTDFILWYFNRAYKACKEERAHYEDDLVRIEFERHFFIHDYFISLDHFLSTIEEYEINISYKNPFLKSIIKKSKEFNWVDIESEYYSFLVQLYRRLEKNVDGLDTIRGELISLNNCFELIKENLSEYLTSIDQESKKIIPNIKVQLKKLVASDFSIRNDTLVLVNFNYTSTIEMYFKSDESFNYKIINIHGKLNDPENPIIFGYGDEMDRYYEELERLNLNEFLKNMKSFNYFNTTNYQDISRFIETHAFQVNIMGHSCGISDRILLNSIFENVNCKRIKIFYHLKDDVTTDFFEKTQELSRHFNPINKGNMRNIIVPIVDCSPLVPNLKAN